MQVPHNEKNISHVYKSKYNHERKNQVVLLMITDGKKRHYTALKSEQTEDGLIRPTKSLSRLFKGITWIIKEIIIVWIVCINLEATVFLKSMRNYVKIMIILTLKCQLKKITL